MGAVFSVCLFCACLCLCLSISRSLSLSLSRSLYLSLSLSLCLCLCLCPYPDPCVGWSWQAPCLRRGVNKIGLLCDVSRRDGGHIPLQSLRTPYSARAGTRWRYTLELLLEWYRACHSLVCYCDLLSYCEPYKPVTRYSYSPTVKKLMIRRMLS